MPDHHFRLASGQPLRIDGRAFVVGMITDGGRVFVEKESGVERLLSNAAQIAMAREGRITTEAMWTALDANVRECIATDWDAFPPDERDVMQWRVKFMRAIEGLEPRRRRKRDAITDVIDAICGKQPTKGPGTGGEDRDDDLTDGEPVDAAPADGAVAEDGAGGRRRPTVRMVRDWHVRFLAAGKDIRALADQSFRKGRGPQLPEWMVEEIQGAIDEVYATRPGGNLADTRRRAVDRIRIRMAKENLALPAGRPPDILGVNAITPFIKARDDYDLNLARLGKAEADRLATAVAPGPQGAYPLGEVEVDHTPLDIVVLDEERRLVLGRPWLTAMIDRYTRCIVGFSISFHPPSWTTVMEALRVAVSDKAPLLADLGGIRATWTCQGVPDVLICDNGKEFHSISMREAGIALGMRILYMPRKKGWLKGKIERWFKTLEIEIFHKISGTTLSNVVERKDYDSEGLAVLTMRQVNWLVGKFVVDVYNQRPHGKTGKPPAVRWDEAVRDRGAKLPPPPGLLAPLTGIATTATLGREGVRARNLVWNSNGFSALRNRIGPAETVCVRIDPLDLAHAHVLDEASREWIRGDLQASGPEAGLTLHQYEVVCKRMRETRTPDEDRLAALSRARAEIFAEVRSIVEDNRKSKAGKRFARFAKDGRKPSEHIAPTVHDPVASAGPLGSHPAGRAIAAPPAVGGPSPALPGTSPESPAAPPTGKRRGRETTEAAAATSPAASVSPARAADPAPVTITAPSAHPAGASFTSWRRKL